MNPPERHVRQSLISPQPLTPGLRPVLSCDARWHLVTSAALTLGVVASCAHVPNQFREDGPSVTATWDSPTMADVKSQFEPTPPRQRPWPSATVPAESGAVVHWPLYFEDPFEDKGHGRTDESHPHDVYRGGWEDYVALPYCYARFTANWLLLPVSAILTPPCTLMESDGRLSRQLLGYDHDAAAVGGWLWRPPSSEHGPDAELPAAEGEPPTSKTVPSPR